MGEDAVDELLRAAHMISPDKESELGFTAMVKKMRESGLGHVIIEDVLLDTMVRARKAGEWPRAGGV